MDAEARRLLWHCRRGLKELDVLLGRYAGAALAGAGEPERRALARLLEQPDPQLAGYLLGGRVPQDPELARLVARILAFAAGRDAARSARGS
jgi:antitoxin CptB